MKHICVFSRYIFCKKLKQRTRPGEAGKYDVMQGQEEDAVWPQNNDDLPKFLSRRGIVTIVAL